ncbi:hypothetical protein [Sphingomonas sp.]
MEERAATTSRPATAPGWWAATAWTILAALFWLYQADGYRGWFAALSEWQYQRFGQALPFFTFLLLLALVTVPVWLIVWGLNRRRTRRLPLPPGIEMAGRFARITLTLGIVLAVLAVATLGWGLLRPQATSDVRLVAPGTSASDPGAGVVAGAIDYRLTATASRDVMFLRREVRFAPVIEPGNPGGIAYFAQLSSTEAESTGRETRAAANRVPGAILTLYRNLGYRIADPHYLIDATPQNLRWPYLALTAQLGLLALVALAMAAVQRRRLSRLRNADREETPPAPAAA